MNKSSDQLAKKSISFLRLAHTHTHTRTAKKKQNKTKKKTNKQTKKQTNEDYERTKGASKEIVVVNNT